MDRLADRNAIVQTCHQLAYASDELDWSLLASLCIPDQTITIDMSAHLGDHRSIKATPTELIESTRLALSGFTGTQHFVSNHVVVFDNVDNAKANIKAMVQAYHCIEMDGKLESVTFRGTWDIDMELYEQSWMLRKMVIKRYIPFDNPGLYAVARERAERGEGRKGCNV